MVYPIGDCRFPKGTLGKVSSLLLLARTNLRQASEACAQSKLSYGYVCYYFNAFFDFWQVFLLPIYKEIQGGAFLRRLAL
jgi:hypothetical protein